MCFQPTEERTMKSFKVNAAVLGSAILLSALGSGAVTAQVTKGTDNATSAGSPAMRAGEREGSSGAARRTSGDRDTDRRRMADAATPEKKARIRSEYVKAADAKAADTKAADAPAPAPKLVGDPVRGATLHRGCFGCHGIERYVAPVTYAAASIMDSVRRASGLSDLPPAEPARFKGRIKSLAALREGVNRRNDYLSPKMTPQEVEDVVAYLNVTYYNFPQ